MAWFPNNLHIHPWLNWELLLLWILLLLFILFFLFKQPLLHKAKCGSNVNPSAHCSWHLPVFSGEERESLRGRTAVNQRCRRARRPAGPGQSHAPGWRTGDPQSDQHSVRLLSFHTGWEPGCLPAALPKWVQMYIQSTELIRYVQRHRLSYMCKHSVDFWYFTLRACGLGGCLSSV